MNKLEKLMELVDTLKRISESLGYCKGRGWQSERDKLYVDEVTRITLEIRELAASLEKEEL